MSKEEKEIVSNDANIVTPEIFGLEIDLSELSYADSMAMTRLDSISARASVMGEMASKGNNTEELQREMLEISSPKFLEDVFYQVRLIMAKTVKRLPAAWLVSNVPSGLTVSDPDYYMYLRADKVNLLRKLIREKQADAAKN